VTKEINLFEVLNQLNQLPHKIIHSFEALVKPAAQNSVNATKQLLPKLLHINSPCLVQVLVVLTFFVP